jgi:hypothetical protein
MKQMKKPQPLLVLSPTRLHAETGCHDVKMKQMKKPQPLLVLSPTRLA